MRKIFILLFAYFFTSIISCCRSDGRIYYETIESVASFVNSKDADGNWIYEGINPEEIYLSIEINSVSTEIGYSSLMNFGSIMYACDDGIGEIITNKLDSVKVFTIFDFN